MDRQIPDWNNLYQNQAPGTMPWYWAELDPDFRWVLKTYPPMGRRLLDLGCGPGTQAVALARLGFDVTGSDVSEAAIAGARDLAKKEKVMVDFRADDILDTQLTGPFDAIVDRGCFHCFHPRERGRYLASVLALLRDGGLLYLKCFSHEEKREEGPYRFSPRELEELFQPPFFLLTLRSSEFQGTLPQFPMALFSVIQKRENRFY